MDAKQATQITSRFQAVFPNASHWNVKAYCGEWFKNLMRLDYNRAFEATERAIKESKYCPNIGEFNTFYYQVRVTKKDEIVKCEQCAGYGVIVFKKLWEGRPYEYAAYCDKCAAGDKYKYNGTEIKENKSDYYTNPITSYAGMVEEPNKVEPTSEALKTVKSFINRFKTTETVRNTAYENETLQLEA